jgi:hypothetical protein
MKRAGKVTRRKDWQTYKAERRVATAKDEAGTVTLIRWRAGWAWFNLTHFR